MGGGRGPRRGGRRELIAATFAGPAWGYVFPNCAHGHVGRDRNPCSKGGDSQDKPETSADSREKRLRTQDFPPWCAQCQWGQVTAIKDVTFL